MITRLENFKNFADETLRPGPFTVIVGANASGKSDIRDAFRFLHGIGRGYALADIVGGKYGTDGQWTGSPPGQEVLNSRGVSRAARFALAGQMWGDVGSRPNATSPKVVPAMSQL